MSLDSQIEVGCQCLLYKLLKSAGVTLMDSPRERQARGRETQINAQGHGSNIQKGEWSRVSTPEQGACPLGRQVVRVVIKEQPTDKNR